MQVIKWNQLNASEKEEVLSRPVVSQSRELSAKVAEIIAAVREYGDRELKALTERFDHVCLEQFKVSQEEFIAAQSQVSDEAKKAIHQAAENIRLFHQAQRIEDQAIETLPGVKCWREVRPIERVGLYVPGGSAPLPSTVMMLGIPSQLASCPVRVLCTPPSRDGSIDPHILYAAEQVGIDQVYKVGGAQAVAAMAFGTESIPKVDKIFGPGNSWVTEAKVQVSQDPKGALYDMPAGPSEVLIIGDESAEADLVASDILSQLEHGPDSQAVFLCTSQQVAESVLLEIEEQMKSLSRNSIIEQSLQRSELLVLDSLEECFKLSNSYAPEHLILHLEDAEAWTAKVTHAGSVFVGCWSPESVGDYASGTNHVLPTYGYAAAIGGLSLDSFQKYITFQRLDKKGISKLGPTVECLARIEGLDAHEQAVTLRLKKIEEAAK